MKIRMTQNALMKFPVCQICHRLWATDFMALHIKVEHDIDMYKAERLAEKYVQLWKAEMNPIVDGCNDYNDKESMEWLKINYPYLLRK